MYQTVKLISNEPELITEYLMASYQLQKSHFLVSETESYQQRKNHLLNLKKMLVENREQLLNALNQDYGNRSYHESLMAEIITVTDDINTSIKNLKKWMKVQRRKVDITMYFGAKNRVIPQPLGVVGMIVPWNFPINLTFSGLSSIFAAGNSAMIKMSENSINLSNLLIELVPKYFKAEKLQVFKETGNVGPEFSKVPFDHLLFTGSGETGRKVMAAAAANLTPVTLELGGKSPAIIDPKYPLKKAVERIMFVKQFNAGQICTTVDYVFVHESQLNDFVDMTKDWVKQHCPDINNKDFTSIIDNRSFERLSATLDDAKNKGANVINLSGQEPQADTRKFPITLVLNASSDSLINNRETFGPILMVKTYKEPQEVISYINQRDYPLALYPFTHNKVLANLYIDRIMSGGVAVNDALFHVGQHDLPFGGVGASGIGHYHGYEGFLTFSKLRPVFYQAKFTLMKFLAPPYGKFADKMLHNLAKFKA